MKKLISIFLPNLRGGGVEKIRIILANQFANKGYKVEFVLMRAEGELLEEARIGHSIISLNVARFRSLALPLALYLKRRKPDVIMVAMWPLTAIVPIFASIFAGKSKVLVSEHSVLSLQYSHKGIVYRLIMSSLLSLSYRLSHARIAVSKVVKNDISEISNLKQSAFTVINNPLVTGYSSSSLSISSADLLWGAPPCFRILTVGSLKPVKNHRLLVKAFARLSDQRARLMILGEGLERDSLLELSHQLDLGMSLIMPGFFIDPSPFYETADLFVLSSDYEGFGNVILEALSHGLPIVATDSGSGPTEILEDGRWGTIVPVNDEIALADAIDKALKGCHDKEALKSRAFQFKPKVAAEMYLSSLGC